jgi:PAS domain S-box-containing protein
MHKGWMSRWRAANLAVRDLWILAAVTVGSLGACLILNPFDGLLWDNQNYNQYNRDALLTLLLVVTVALAVFAARRWTRQRRSLRSMFDGAEVLLMTLDADLRVLHINRKGCELLGRPPREILGRPWCDAFVPERFRDSTRRLLERMIRGNSKPLLYFEGPILGPRDHSVIIGWHLRRSVESDGQITIFSSGEDISGLHRARMENRVLLRRTAFILGATHTGLDIVDRNLNVRYVNPEWKKLYGDPSGKTCCEYFSDAGGPCPDCGVRKALETGQSVVTERYRPREDRWVQITHVPFQDEIGEWLVAQVQVDVSRYKQIEMALSEKEQRIGDLARFVGESPSPVIRIHSDGMILFANQAAEPLFEDWKSGTGKPCPAVIQDLIRAVLQADQRQYLDIACGNRLFSMDCVPFPDAGYVNLYGREITRDKAAQNQLINLNASLEQTVEALNLANQELRDFAKVVAHDLKSPIRAIVTLSEWIARDYRDQLDEPGREQISLLEQRARKLNQIVDSILVYCGVGRTPMRKETVCLKTLLDQVIEDLRIPDPIRVERVGCWPAMICERQRVAQVFHNLLSNAVKYNNSPDPWIRIEARQTETEWTFSVSDNGPGIDPRYHHKLFQLFQTIEDGPQGRGTGVGLALIRKVVEDIYGGAVRLDSAPHQGSKFTLSFPRHLFVELSESISPLQRTLS